jgi:hypothetical protein
MELIEDVKRKLTLEGRKRIFKDAVRLSSEHIIDKAHPKDFTKENLVEVVFKKCSVNFLKGKYFVDMTGTKIKADYHLANKRGDYFLAQVKPINYNLYVSNSDGAINKIRRLFRIAEVRAKFKFGIATDGKEWIFIDKKGVICFSRSIKNAYSEIRAILRGKKVVDSEHFDEDSWKAWEEAFD